MVLIGSSLSFGCSTPSPSDTVAHGLPALVRHHRRPSGRRLGTVHGCILGVRCQRAGHLERLCVPACSLHSTGRRWSDIEVRSRLRGVLPASLFHHIDIDILEYPMLASASATASASTTATTIPIPMPPMPPMPPPHPAPTAVFVNFSDFAKPDPTSSEQPVRMAEDGGHGPADVEDVEDF